MIDIKELRRLALDGDFYAIHELLDRLEVAEKDNKVLSEALTEKVASETMLRNLSVGDGSFNASFEGGAVHPLVAALSGQFSESGAENYLEMHFHSPATGPLVTTVQRDNGKTPHQLREAAEKDIAMKEKLIDSLGAELNAVSNERDCLLDALRKMLVTGESVNWDETFLEGARTAISSVEGESK